MHDSPGLVFVFVRLDLALLPGCHLFLHASRTEIVLSHSHHVLIGRRSVVGVEVDLATEMPLLDCWEGHLGLHNGLFDELVIAG